jgi:hypothetical protein
MRLNEPQDTTLANRRQMSRRLSSPCPLKIPYTAFMNPEKLKDTTQANRRRPSRRQSSRLRSRFGQEKLRDAMRHDASKPTPSVETPIIATGTKFSTCSVEEPQIAIRHDYGKPSESVATQIAGRREGDMSTVISRNLTSRNLTQPNPT